jgi:hypothetical protein
MDSGKNEHGSEVRETEEENLLEFDERPAKLAQPNAEILDGRMEDHLEQIERATEELVELDAVVQRVAEEEDMHVESVTREAEIITTTEQVDENTEVEIMTTITTEEARLIPNLHEDGHKTQDTLAIEHETTKVLVQKTRQVVEIHNKPAIDESAIEEQIFKERLANCLITETLLSNLKDKTNYVDLSKADEAYQDLEKDSRAKLDTIMDNQTKIYNKILWINILAEKITADNDPKALKFDDKATVKKCEELQKFEIEVGKTKGYLDLLSARMNRAEKELDAYFYNLLKKHQMSESNLI